MIWKGTLTDEYFALEELHRHIVVPACVQVQWSSESERVVVFL